MVTENEIIQSIRDKERAINLARSYHQYLDEYRDVPDELFEEYKKLQEKQLLCSHCKPSLIIIPSLACYKRSPHLWPNFFFMEHNVREIDLYDFEGIRGFYFSLSNGNWHGDFVEMDDIRYSDRVNTEAKIALLKRFYQALKDNNHESVAISQRNQDREHLSTYGEVYLGLLKRISPGYILQVDQVLKVN